MHPLAQIIMIIWITATIKACCNKREDSDGTYLMALIATLMFGFGYFLYKIQS